MIKRLVALPFLAVALIAAKPAPPEKPVSVVAPAEVAADPANRWTLELSNGGRVVIQLRPDIAPLHVYRIQQLTSQGFYDGLTFHRVIPGFMAQGGDPRGTGEGGSPLPDLAAELNDLPHLRGVASMARAQDMNSANSQFFIMLAPRFALDHKYSAFGRVIEGMAAVDGIAVGEPPAQPTRIVRATIGGPLPAPPVVAAAAAPSAEAPAAAALAAPPAEPAQGPADGEPVAAAPAASAEQPQASAPAEPAAPAAPEAVEAGSPAPADLAPDGAASLPDVPSSAPEAVQAPDALPAESAAEEAPLAAPAEAGQEEADPTALDPAPADPDPVMEPAADSPVEEAPTPE